MLTRLYIFFIVIGLFSCKSSKNAGSVYDQSGDYYAKKVEGKKKEEVIKEHQTLAEQTATTQASKNLPQEIEELKNLNQEQLSEAIGKKANKKLPVPIETIPSSDKDVVAYVKKYEKYQSLSKDQIYELFPGKKGKQMVKKLKKLDKQSAQLQQRIEKLEANTEVKNLLDKKGYGQYGNDVEKWMKVVQDESISDELNVLAKSELKKFEKDYWKHLEATNLIDADKLDSLTKMKTKLESQYGQYIVPLETLNAQNADEYLDQVIKDTTGVKEKLLDAYRKVDPEYLNYSEEQVSAKINEIMQDSLNMQQNLSDFNSAVGALGNAEEMSGSLESAEDLQPMYARLIEPEANKILDSLQTFIDPAQQEYKTKEKEIDEVVKEVELIENSPMAYLKRNSFFDGYVGLPLGENKNLSLSPNYGLNLRDWVSVGAGLNFVYSFNKDNWFDYTGGYKIFTKAEVYKKRILIQFEYNGYVPAMTQLNPAETDPVAMPGEMFLGGGINLKITEKSNFTLSVMYKLNENEVKVVDAPWVLRLGMQLF